MKDKSFVFSEYLFFYLEKKKQKLVKYRQIPETSHINIR